MYKKLQLNKTHAFELAIGTKLICEMLVDFINGKCKYKSLGKEQGDVQKWDDFILMDLKGDFVHYQIKENNVAFSDHSIERDQFTRGNRKGELHDLSEFDKTIEALILWFRKNPDPKTRKSKHFILSVPYHAIEIKKNLSLIVLSRLCNEQIKPLTDVAGLIRLATADSQIQSLYTWLTEWCGFTSWDEVLEVFSQFEVKASNSTAEINKHTNEILAQYFNDADNVRQLIEKIITDDINFTSLLPAKYVLEKVRWAFLSKVSEWSKYLSRGNNIYVSGIQDISNPYEYPTAIIDGIWDNSRSRSLYFDIPLDWKGTALYQSIIRICLHLPPGNKVFAKERQAVITHLLEEVGDTIGNQPLDSDRFAILEDRHIEQSSIERELSAVAAIQFEADTLSAEMSRHTWNHVIKKVTHLLRNTQPPLITELEKRWDSLRSALDDNPDRRQQLFRSMMHPKAERQNLPADLRVGPATAAILAEAIYFHLIVLTALGAPNDDFEEYSGIKIQTLALMTWSGPMETTTRRVRKLSENADQLMGKQPCAMLIMPQVDATLDYLVSSNLASTIGGDNNLATGRQIRSVVTGIPDLKKHIENGDIGAIRQHIRRIAP